MRTGVKVFSPLTFLNGTNSLRAYKPKRAETMALSIIISALFLLARFVLPFEGVIHKEDLFKDFAHLWVGAMFGIGFHELRVANWRYAKPWLLIGAAMTIGEVAASFCNK